jgi:hypothetical protein
VIYEEFLRKHGHDTLVVDFDNGQSFGRAKEVDWHGKVYSVTKKDTIVPPEITKAVNSCDVAIFHSHPTRKQSAYADRYREFVAAIDQPIIVMHDHSIAKTNINAIPQACELFAMADTIVIQSPEGYSFEAYNNFDPGLKDNYIIENPIWIQPSNFDKYRKPFEERDRHLLYMGRMSPLKDPAMICRIQPHMEGWDLSIIGCENSISSVSMYDEDLSINPAPYVPAFRPMIYQHILNKHGEYTLSDKEKAKDGRICSYDKYRYDWGMTQMGSSFASWCGYKLSDPKEYGHRMEYTVIESYLLSLPIINRHFAENARSPEGKLWGDYDCALVAQAREEEALADKLNSIQKKEWEERTEACRGLITKFNDIDNIGLAFLDQVVKNGKRPNKVNGMDFISEYFPSARERRANGELVMSSANGTLKRTPMVMIDGKQQIIKEAPVQNSLEDFFA